MLGFGCDVNVVDILIISGCQEVIVIVFKCVIELGDVVLLELFIYYGLLQMIDMFGLCVIEILCYFDIGVDLSKVEDVCC